MNNLTKIEKLEKENKRLHKELINLQNKKNNTNNLKKQKNTLNIPYKADFKKYHFIFDNIPVGIIIFDNNLNVVNVNKTYLSMFEITREVSTNLNINSLKDVRIIKAFKQVLQGFEGFFEGQYIPTFSKVLGYISIHTKPHSFYNKKNELINGGIAIIKDITEDKLAEKAVSKSYDTFQTVTDNINSQVCVINYETENIIFMNSKAKSILGDIVSTKYYTHNIFKQIRNKYYEVYKKQELTNSFVDEVFDNKTNKWFNCSSSIIKWINEEKVILINATEITKSKEFELKLTEKNKELEFQTEALEKAVLGVIEKNVRINMQAEQLVSETKTKSKMFSIIGHDLRGPVGNIQNALDLILDEYHEMSKEDIKDFLIPLRDSAGIAYNLLANLLYWAKNESGMMQANPENFILNLIIDEVITLFKTNFDIKNIKLNYKPQKEYTVYADENMIHTVVRNLISNAVKFTKEYGEVSIRITEIEKENKNYVMLSVQDTGIGISQKNINKILNTKQHFSTYGTNNEKGSGLGMAICRGFMRKNNGDFKLESKENKGSTFSITIPVENYL